MNTNPLIIPVILWTSLACPPVFVFKVGDVWPVQMVFGS